MFHQYNNVVFKAFPPAYMKPVVLGRDNTSELVVENSTEDSSSRSSGSPNSLCSFLSFSMVDC